jgi:hypothetical protein
MSRTMLKPVMHVNSTSAAYAFLSVTRHYAKQCAVSTAAAQHTFYLVAQYARGDHSISKGAVVQSTALVI